MNNKKIIIFVISLIFVFSALSLNAQFKDGVYSGTYDYFDSHGWKPQLDITVSKGKIVKAAMNYVNKKGELKSNDKAYAEAMKKKTNIAPSEAYAKLQDAIIKKQAAGVDAVTGATDSSKYFNTLAKLLLDNAKNGDTKKIILPMNDTYIITDAADKDGYAGKISVEFKDGKITKAIYDELNKNVSKSANDAANKDLKSKAGKSFKEISDQLASDLIAKQNADSIVQIKGAENISKRFQELAKKAISSR